MKKKRGFLRGGGRATRLRPITTTINKHLIPLANKPMIFHAIEKAVAAGIEEIFINVNPGETQLQKYVGDGGHWGVNITFFEQTGGPLGIAHVVKCAEKFIGNDPLMFFLSDNIIHGGFEPFFKQFEKEKLDCLLAFAQVPDPERFGVPAFSAEGKLIEVLEKPQNPPSQLAQTGIYLYGPKVFFKAFDHIQKSARGEYEISDIHSYLLREGFKVGWREVTGWWKDTGKPEDLVLTNKLLLDELAFDRANFRQQGTVIPGASIEGPVQIGIGATIGAGVKIIGPVMIGENCTLDGCAIGPHVTIGAGSTIRQANIRESLIFSNCTIDSSITIAGSIVGDQAKVLTNPAGKEHHLILGDHTLIEL